MRLSSYTHAGTDLEISNSLASDVIALDLINAPAFRVMSTRFAYRKHNSDPTEVSHCINLAR